MTQNKLIAFCYLFITGIGLAMAFPLGREAVFPLWGLTALLGLLTVGALVLVRRLRPPVENDSPYAAPVQVDTLQVSIWLLVLLTGLVFGYTRYLAMVQPPERLLGHLQIQGETSTWTPGAGIDKTSFLKIKILEPVEEDIHLRLTGRLEALQPVRNDRDQPKLDEKGRWLFSQSNVPQESDVIHIPAGTAAGTEVLIQQPFTHLDRVEMLNQPARGALAVYQPLNSVDLFARSGRNVVPVSILGRITADPWVYSFKTILSITPDYIQYRPDGPYLKVDRQTIRVTIKPDLPGYDRLARSAAYGYDVALTGELVAPAPAANPGSFDQATYTRNNFIGGQMNLRTPRNGPPALSVIIPAGQDVPREGNGLVEFALYLRDEMVRVIKQTSPQPNSNFLGAVTLGLRYGMQNTASIAFEDHAKGVVAPLVNIGQDDEVLIADEFRASGVAHILAVSGLHVTFITVMFVGIFTLLKVSKKVYVPFVIFALIIFAIITGARPSTLRAVIMNSIWLLTWGYMGQSVRSSALLSLPIAAFIILIQNPAMCVDPSFTLSFGAILSLVLLTSPFFDLFKKFQGNNFIALLIMVGVLTWAFVSHWLLVTTLRFWLGYGLLAIVLFWLARILTRLGFTPIRNFGFANIHPVVGGFIAAQFGMQIGMMLPLSAYYFYRWPVAGSYANLLAIPLAGVVLQLSILAGLLGLIPGIGIYLALLFNASNWIFSTLFLLIGHFFSVWFPYPYMVKPTLRWLFIYYAAVAGFVWWRPLWFRLLRPRWQRSSTFRFGAVAAAVLVGAGVVISDHTEFKTLHPDGELAVTVLSVSYGSAILVDTPDNQFILIDSAFVQPDRGRRNEAERTILPFIGYMQIPRLDALVLTSRNPEHVAGASSILRHLDVDQLLYPASVAPVLETGELARLIADRHPQRLKHRLADSTVATRTLAAGDRLFETEVDGKPFAIEVLGPAEGDAKAPLSLRIVYGDFTMLIPSDLTFKQQQALIDSVPAADRQARIVVIPNHGTAGLEGITVGMPKNYALSQKTITGKLLTEAGAEATILEFGNPRPVTGDKYKVAIQLYGSARRTAEDVLPEARHLATETEGAITVRSDGDGYDLAGRYDSAVGFVDAPTSLEIGW